MAFQNAASRLIIPTAGVPNHHIPKADYLMRDRLLESDDAAIFNLQTNSPGPAGTLPLTEEMLLASPSGDLFGMSQNAGMGWEPSQLLRKQFLILGTQGGIRADDGHPIALGYHTGHWEIGLLMRAAAEQLDKLERLP